jgi:hypothetical protein
LRKLSRLRPSAGVLLVAEHPVVGFEWPAELLDSHVQVRGPFLHDELRDGHSADLVRLRRAADQLAGDRLERLGDVDPPTGGIEPADPQSAHLAGAQSAVGGEQDEEPVIGPDGVCDSGDLAGVEEGRNRGAVPRTADDGDAPDTARGSLSRVRWLGSARLTWARSLSGVLRQIRVHPIDECNQGLRPRPELVLIGPARDS